MTVSSHPSRQGVAGRWSLAAGVLVVGLLPVPGTVAAQQYQGCQASVDELEVVQGATIVVTGSGAEPTTAPPGALVTAGMPERIGSGFADANGNFEFPAVIPADAAVGSRVLTVDCDNAATSIVIVVGPLVEMRGPSGTSAVPSSRTPASNADTVEPQLSSTGAELAVPILRLAVVAVAVGAVAITASRRRRWADRRQP